MRPVAVREFYLLLEIDARQSRSYRPHPQALLSRPLTTTISATRSTELIFIICSVQTAEVSYNAHLPCFA